METVHEARIGIADAYDLDPSGFRASRWEDHHETLHALCSAAFLDALEKDDLQGALDVCAEYHTLLGQEGAAMAVCAMQPADIAPARQLVAALPALSASGSMLGHLLEPFPAGNERSSFMSCLPRIEEIAGQVKALFSAEDQTTPWTAPGSQVKAWEIEHASLERLRAAARARLRCADLEGSEEVVVDLKATPQALVEFVAEHSGREGYEGLRAQWKEARVLVGDQTVHQGDVSVGASVVAILDDGRRMRMRVSAGVGEQDGDSKVQTLTAARRFCFEHGLPDEAVVVEPVTGERPEEPVLDDAPRRGNGGVVGSDVCRHEGADWRDSGYGEALLSCRRCYRGAAAAIPLHRLPEDHVLSVRLSLEPEATYLRQLTARASLRGEPLPQGTVAELRGRDGLAPLDPAHYAVGRVPLGAPGRGGDLASALSECR